jgi:hypothetical protein
MRKIRIRGLVKHANRTRDELSRPLSHERLVMLQKRVKNALQQIDDIVKQENATVDSLAVPSLKAYRFLSNLDFDAIDCSDTAPDNNCPVGSVSFRGLRSSLQGILDQWPLALKEERLQEVYQHLRSSSEHLEKLIDNDSISPEQLTRQTREIRGWLAYFAQRDHFDDYVTAFRTATSCFVEAARGLPKLPNEVTIYFRPMRGLYRMRKYRNLLLVQLPTPMISFDRNTFEVLAGLALYNNGQKQTIMDAMLGDPYQSVFCELELLAGVTDNSIGIWHDLAKSYERVNVAYFSSSLARPRLIWSPVFTSRKFGHYDQAHDTVMISATLDRNDVPELAVDFIMYHELLHKKLGVVWANGRKSAHSADFSREERRFLDYDKAQIVLKKLAGDSRERHAIVSDNVSRKQITPGIEHKVTKTSRIPPSQRVARNAPCPCGSGRKYKKCCGK